MWETKELSEIISSSHYSTVWSGNKLKRKHAQTSVLYRVSYLCDFVLVLLISNCHLYLHCNWRRPWCNSCSWWCSAVHLHVWPVVSQLASNIYYHSSKITTILNGRVTVAFVKLVRRGAAKVKLRIQGSVPSKLFSSSPGLKQRSLTAWLQVTIVLLMSCSTMAQFTQPAFWAPHFLLLLLVV